MFGLPATTLVPAALIFLAVAFGTISLALLVDIFQERRRRDGRAAPAPRLHQQPAGRGSGAAPRARRVRSRSGSRRSLSAVRAFEDAHLMIEQAGSSMTLAVSS